MTLKPKKDRFESYEVYDDQGNSVGRVVLPRQKRFLGSRRGTVLLRHQPVLRSARDPRAA